MALFLPRACSTERSTHLFFLLAVFAFGLLDGGELENVAAEGPYENLCAIRGHAHRTHLGGDVWMASHETEGSVWVAVVGGGDVVVVIVDLSVALDLALTDVLDLEF